MMRFRTRCSTTRRLGSSGSPMGLCLMERFAHKIGKCDPTAPKALLAQPASRGPADAFPVRRLLACCVRQAVEVADLLQYLGPHLVEPDGVGLAELHHYFLSGAAAVHEHRAELRPSAYEVT